jgi:HAD superfamily hydrolase (TIGR01509 family)
MLVEAANSGYAAAAAASAMQRGAGRFRALALDMDGTVLDSERVLLRLWDEIAREKGFVFAWEVMVSTVGTTSDLTHRILTDAYPDAPHEEIRKEMARQYRLALGAGKVPPRPGLMQLLSHARAKGLAIGLCTSTRRATTEVAIKETGLAGWFDALVCAKEAAAGKPDPAPYLLMAERLGHKPTECIAVEDSPAGARSALGAGFTVAVVPDLVTPPQEIAERAVVLPTLADVIALIM